MGINISTIRNYGSATYDKIDSALDWMSNNICLTKPSYQLILNEMSIPKPDRELMEQILQLFVASYHFIVSPLRHLNDKKFTTHIYESSAIFRSDGSQIGRQPLDSCDKAIMYIHDHIDNIEESECDMTKSDVTIRDNNYLVPVNYWYTYPFNNICIYFYIHINQPRSYKGILFATLRENSANLMALREKIFDYYNRNAGVINRNSEIENLTMADILDE